MKINLAVETAEFNFIKHAIEQQTKQLVQYMDSMLKVAVHLDRTPENLDETIERLQRKAFEQDERYANWKKQQDNFEKECDFFGPEIVIGEDYVPNKNPKRRGRPPAKKRGRPAKAKA